MSAFFDDLIGPKPVLGPKLKVQDGTREGGEWSLCRSCSYGNYTEGRSYRETVITCRRLVFPGPYGVTCIVPYPIKKCSGFVHKNLPSISAMEEVAWIITTDSRTRQIGFKPMRKLSNEEKERLPGYKDPIL